MKVLAGPRLDLAGDPIAEAMCRRLAGENGTVVSLARLGVRNPYRPYSAAELGVLRRELYDVRRNTGRGEDRTPDGTEAAGAGVIGYVCRGVRAPGGATACIAVTDHANLTWRSPLNGPNDEQVGPRFPGMVGVYAPELVSTLAAGRDGMIVVPGVVAGVQNDAALSEYETEMLVRLHWEAASSELVAPVIVAAHMGIRVAAALLAT